MTAQTNKGRFGTEYHQHYASKNRGRRRQTRRDWDRRVHDEVIRHYGGVCACCAEAMPEFLWLYPAKGIPMPSGYGSLALRLRAQEFPEGFRVFCRNCGPLIEKGGCPHKAGAV